ncbi:MAG: hypothetical protein ACK4GN_11890 [Runella sp.]
MAISRFFISGVKLWAVFSLIVIVVVFKIKENPAFYLTPDSHYYLQAAQNLLDGHGYRIIFEGKDTFCAIWPVGYAASIGLTSFITTLPVDTASKLVNLLALAGCFWLLQVRYQDRAWFLALVFMASSLVQMFANTWSETLFLFFVLGYVHNQNNRSGFLWATCAFLSRYAGVFLLIQMMFKRRFIPVFLLLLFVSSYLIFNYSQTQTFTGGHGFLPNEPFLTRCGRGVKGLGEEVLFFFLRDWGLKNPQIDTMTLWLIYGVAVIQFSILFYVIKHLSRVDILANWLKNDYFIIATSYLVFMVGLYLIDASIENLYFRRLAPFSFFAYLGLLDEISHRKEIYEKIKGPMVMFFVLSLFHAWPK